VQLLGVLDLLPKTRLQGSQLNLQGLLIHATVVIMHLQDACSQRLVIKLHLVQECAIIRMGLV
jgi:hypothetical protein